MVALAIFAIGGGLAGLAGVFFANSGSLVSPKMFSLWMTAQPIIYVIVGGLGTLTGPIIGTVLMQYLIGLIGEVSQKWRAIDLDPNRIIGAILILFVLLVPRGLVPAVHGGLVQKRRRGRIPTKTTQRRRRRKRPRAAEAGHG